tara:strand:- start:403 stop:720 length:318 start_codon:yes stop_codon:yes gene_type:complete
MLLFVIKNAIISMLIIFLLHYIYDYFKTSLTTPKVKDLVNKPQIQYNEILKTINENKKTMDTSIKKEKIEQQVNMKNELKKYMNEINSEENIPLSMENTNLYQSF